MHVQLVLFVVPLWKINHILLLGLLALLFAALQVPLTPAELEAFGERPADLVLQYIGSKLR